MTFSKSSKYSLIRIAITAALILFIQTPLFADDYTWDISTSSGITPGNGTWGSNSYWTLTSGAGTSLVAWVGTGGWTATFGGVDGTYAISVANNPYCDSITFKNSGYTLSSGTIYGNSCLVTPVSIFGFTPPYGNNAAVDSLMAWDGNTATYCDGPDVASVTYTGMDIGAARAIVKIRYWPRTLWSARMVGAIIQGSNTSNSAGFIDVYTISAQPTEGTWTTVYPADTTPYRWWRYASPAHGCCNVNEIEFYTYSAIAVASAKTATISSVLTNLHAYGLEKYGAGTLTLSGANTFTDMVRVRGGTLIAGNGAALGDYANTVNIFSGAALDVGGQNLQSYTLPILLNGQVNSTTGCLINTGASQTNAIQAITLNSDASIGSNDNRFDIGRGYSSYTYIVGNSHTLTKVGTNAVSVLTQATGLTAVVINGGILSQEINNAFGTAPITINAGAQHTSYNSLTIANNITMNDKSAIVTSSSASNATTYSGTIATAGADTLENNTANVTTLTGIISGTGQLYKLNDGAFVLSNASNSFSGGITITGGRIKLGAANVIPDGSGKGDVAVNDTLDMSSYSEGINGLTGTGYVTTTASASPVLTIGNDNDATTFGGVIQNGSGTLALTKAGSGIMYFTGANTYTGTTTISGGTLSLGNGGTTGAISGNVTDNATFAINRSNNYTYSGVISGTGAFTQAGAGTTTLGGSNTYTGITTLSAGVLAAATLANGGSNSNIGKAPNTAGYLVFNGGTLQFTGTSSQSTDHAFTINSTGGAIDASGTSTNTITFSGSSTIASGSPTFTLTGANTSTNIISGVVGGSLALTKTGAGLWALTNANTYSGITTISSGILQIGNGSTTGSIASSASITDNAALNINRSDAITIGQVISGSGTLTQSGGGTITLTGGNTFSGITTISSGALSIDNGGTTGAISNSSNVTDNATFIINRSNNYSYTGVISGSGAFTQAGGGTTTLGSANSYTGATTISAGVLAAPTLANGNVNSSIGHSTNAAANLVFNGGTLQFTGGSSQSSDRNFTINSTGGGLDASGTSTYTLTLSGSSTISSGSPTFTLSGSNTSANTLSGVLGGALTLVKSGAGTWVLTNANSYSGTTTITAGILSVSSLADGGSNCGIGSSSNGAGNLMLSGGQLSYTGGAQNCNRLFTVGTSGATIDASGSGALNLTNTGAIGLSGTGTRTLTITGSNSGSNILAAIIGDQGSNATTLTKTNSGTWILTGANSYSGITTISAGTLQIGNGSTIGSIANSASITDNTALIVNRSDAYTLGQAISGSGTLTQSGGGTTILSANNSYSGITTISAGTLQIGSGSTAGAISNLSNITDNTALAFNRADAYSYTGTISGSGTLAQNGTGTTTLSGNNTYGGGTTVSNGELDVTNSSGSGTGSGAVTLSGGDLGGTGTISGPVTVNSGSSVTPGTGAGGPGKLTMSNNLTFTSGAGFAVDLNGTIAGTTYDQAAVGGNVTLGNAMLTVTLGYAPTVGQTYTVIDNQGSNVVSGTFNNIVEGGSIAASYGGISYIYTVSYMGGTGNDVVLTCSSINVSKIWTNGSGDHNWSNAANWSPSGAPLVSDSIVFVSMYTGDCLLNVTDTIRGIVLSSGYTGTFNFSNNRLKILGTKSEFNSGGTITPGTGGIEFGGTNGVAQVFLPKSGAAMPAITQTGSDTLRISTYALSATSFTQNAGSLDLNGLNMTTTGDFIINNGGSTSLVNMSGRKITVGGNASLNGKQADALYISTAQPCSLAVTGTLNAYGATLGNCKAPDGSSAGTATNSIDAGSNYRWNFNSSPEDYTQWHYSTKVYVNTKEGGANIGANQIAFPLLVRLTSANFNFVQAQSGGQDIRFSKSNGIHFNYQIERWDAANSLADIWVLMDTVKGYNDSQYIRMYWGKSDAVDSSSATKVFATTNNFAGVWHMAEDPSGGAGSIKDETVYGNNGSPHGSMSTTNLVLADVGKGLNFNGSSQYLTATNPIQTLGTGDFAFSSWIKASSTQLSYPLIFSARAANPYPGYMLFLWSDGKIAAQISGSNYNSSSADLRDNSFHYICASRLVNTLSFYVDGAVAGTVDVTGKNLSTTQGMQIGVDEQSPSNSYFNGIIDEPRIDNANRSADWIKLCYETQRANQTTVFLEEKYTEWAYSKSFYLNTRSSGANVANNVIKFPLLVRLDSTVLDFTALRDSGQDIRFAKSDGSHLYYEIEKWDNVNKAASVWVRVDTVYGNDSLHIFTMYWGKTLVNSMSNGRAVFDTGNGFAGVWHFGPTVGGYIDTLRDATVNGFTLTNASSTPAAAGLISLGRTFNGSSGRVYASDAAKLEQTGNLTLSAWINHTTLPTAGGAAMGLLSKAAAEYRFTDSTIIGGNNYLYMTVGGTRYTSNAVTGFATGTWYHAAAAIDATNDTLLFYENGAILGTKISSATATPAAAANAFNVGNDQANNWFSGSMDEVRLERTFRNPDWINLCYQNQKPVQSLVVNTVEDYSKWTYNRKVSINTTQSGANVASTSLAFPVLIRLTGTTFPFSQAQDDGRDIRFASSLGNRLPYQIERWDRGNQFAEIWVLADTVKGNCGTQYINMYWGKTGVTGKSNGAAVFATANSYVTLYHFPTASDTFGDATLNAQLTNSNTTPLSASIIGFGRTLASASSQKLTSPDANVLDLTGSITLSAWINCATMAATMCIVGKDSIAYNLSLTSTKYVRMGVNGTIYTSTVASSMATGVWNHVAAAFNEPGDSVLFYVNGAQLGTKVAAVAVPANQTTQLQVGARQNDQYFNGSIDEVRIQKAYYGSDWIKLCYQNQRASQTLVDLDDYSQWAFSKQIYVNTTTMGLAGNVTQFPLLVRVDTTILDFKQAQWSGQDVRFSKADGTHLQYQVESWDTAGKAGSVWVLVDTVFQSSATQYIKMYWGKSDAIDKSNGGAVFDTANGFAGVWHLNEAANTSAGGYAEATLNNFTGTGNSSTAAAISGVAGKAATINGTNSYIVTSAPVTTQTNNVSLSAWVKFNSATGNTYQSVLFNGNSTSSGYGIYPQSAGNIYALCGAVNFISSTTPLTGSWQLLDLVRDAGTWKMYVNGSLISITGNPTPLAPAGATCIGSGNAAGTDPFKGNIDEARISKVVRGIDWIKLCYYTQLPTQNSITPDGSAEMFQPLTVSPYGASVADSLDSCNISTGKWTMKFSRFSGGGIQWLSPDSMGAGNQLDSNLFSILTNGSRSDTGLGNLKILDQSSVFSRLLQRKKIGGQDYGITYTVLGSGRVYIKAETYASANLAPTGGIEFRISGNTTSNITNVASSSTASSCTYVLHSDAGSNRIDACLGLFENWSQANAITGTGSSKYIGIKSSTWSLPAKRSQAWEFLIDFSHRNWNDSTGVGLRIADYRNPDSMSFFTGTPYLNKAWENQLSGHWQFEEGAGDTALDNSGSNNFGLRPTGSTWTWTGGKWGGGVTLNGGNDKIQVLDNPSFDGLYGFLICAWIMPSAPMTSLNGIFRKFGTGGYSFTGASGGVVQLALNGSTMQGKTGIGSGNWVHVAAQIKRDYSPYDTVKIFVNGKPDTFYVGARYTFDTSNTNALIGSGFSGSIDDVRFYSQNMSDDDVKAIYQLGYDAHKGMYCVRADNNNTINCAMDGGTYQRYFPVFQVTNYWSTNQPSATTPKVYLNGARLVYQKDYFAALDDNRNILTVGLNSIVNANATQIFISSDDTLGATVTNGMPQMSWGAYATPSSHFYVKNFTGNAFAGATANQYYIDFKMDNTVTGSGGEIYRLKTSKVSANSLADTTTTNNLVNVTSATDSASFSCAKFKIGSSWLKSTADIAATPSYTVAESSAVRVMLKINDRKMKKSTDSCMIQTWFTLYPTGQIYRWDSVNIPNATINIDTMRYDVLETYTATGTGTPASAVNNVKLYGGRYGASSYQDNAAALLVLKQAGGVIAPSIFDTAKILTTSGSPNKGTGTRFVHSSQLANANKPFQTALYMDIRQATFTNTTVDSVSKGALYSTGASANRLIANGNGSVVLNSIGDYNGDGFNEREGAYIYQADNANTAHFTLTANADTCRFSPAFRITNYTATSAPQYVYVNSQPKIINYGYNAYIKLSTHELIVQLNQTLCANADVYFSFDRTLAVTMTDFNAAPGDARIKLLWNTQSEENNLGFFLYRRIQPGFLDSIAKIADTVTIPADSTDALSAGALMKTKAIGKGDTAWQQVNKEIIYGATAGVSYGLRKYSLLDRMVYNDVKYEYKLVSVDYNNKHETYGKTAVAMPYRILPERFELWTNFPNPFRRMTCLKYDVPIKTKIMLNIYDVKGRLLRQLVRPDKQMQPGFYQVLWDCKDDRGRTLASGPYIYRITAQGFVKARVMVMMR